MADALDSKSGFSDEVWVQVPPPVPITKIYSRSVDDPGFFVSFPLESSPAGTQNFKKERTSDENR